MKKPLEPDAIILPAPDWGVLLMRGDQPHAIVGPFAKPDHATAWARANVNRATWYAVPLYSREQYDNTQTTATEERRP